ncbi:hypothetical protein R1sor_014247 [Riccia sorocarpa]|uniref:RNA-binding protein 25 n=1 Tax=Riccia sorocarpa TaxID=122646 RepID=A0ABD3H9D8_9MARC
MNPPFASMPPGHSVPLPTPAVQTLSSSSHPSPPVPGPAQVPAPLPVPSLTAPPVVPQAGGTPASVATAPGVAPGVMTTISGARASPGAPGAATTAFPPPIRPFAPTPPMMPNYMAHPGPPQQQQMLPPGVLGTSSAGIPSRYSAPPFNSMARPPAFAPRPPLGVPPPVTMSTMTLPRPPGNGLRPVAPVLKPPPGMTLTELAAKGIGQLAAPPEKPHTTVYVGKIASTVEDEFLRSLLELCGPIKSWKRAQDPTTGSPKGFGFCEFESAEGVLRALRLLNKFSLEGQELVLNVNQATREYLERYVAKKKESEKLIKEEAEAIVKDEELAPGVESIEPPKPSLIQFSKDESTDKGEVSEDYGKKFGLVNDFDKQADEAASQKLASMLEERARLKPLPPPPPLPPAGSLGKTASPFEASGNKDGDPSLDVAKSEDLSARNEDDDGSDQKPGNDTERTETSGDKGRRSERDRERDRERELEREKDRELERYERERERERARRERERDMRLREAERAYEEKERDWEAREREKERQRLHDREREKERERDRRKEIKEQEEESDDDDWKKSRYRASLLDEKRKRRLREREEDAADREREEQELLAAKRQKLEKTSFNKEDIGGEDDYEMAVDEENKSEAPSPQVFSPKDTVAVAAASEADDDQLPVEALSRNGTHEFAQAAEGPGAVVTSNEADLKSSPAPRKLGFGIMGSGKRTTVTSVFHHEDEEEKTDDRRLRPLVPIDYSAEEMEAVALPNPPTVSSPAVASNLAAAAEFAKSLSSLHNVSTGSKEDKKEDSDRDRSRRKRDRPTERDTPRKDKSRDRDRDRERDREREDREKDRDWDRERKDPDKDWEKERVEKVKAPEPKILNAKQLIDTIPKTKEELFAYPVDWQIYDKHDLHERMRPWISKKITEFLGEEETTLVDFVVSNTCKHVTAASMLELLESILDDEAEMFVLKMWRMLIFEIRRVETGLASSKAK